MHSVSLRPHHIESLLEYRRSPWSTRDVEDLYSPAQEKDSIKLLQSLLDDLDTKVKIVAGLDSLCVMCEYASKCSNEDEERIELEDKEALLRFGIKIGETYTIRELLDLVF